MLAFIKGRGPIYVGSHVPPHFNDVPDEMDRFLSVVHENWTVIENPMILPAYALWRLNWIHPFIEGERQNSARGLLLPDLHEARATSS